MPKSLISHKKWRSNWIKSIQSIHHENEFERSLKILHSLQIQNNVEIRRLASSPPTPFSSWKNIPALPQKLFKTLSLLSPHESRIEFHTSGTTTGSPGIHRMRDEQIYKAVALGGCPWRNQAPFTLLSLHPDQMSAPHSSLSFMLDHWMKAYGSKYSRHYFQGSKIDAEKLWNDLPLILKKSKRPILIAGTAFSFVHLFDEWGKNRKTTLPPHTILMETGGYKGRSRELPKKELYQLIQKHFGVDDTQIWNEYGMTELLSQAYSKGHGIFYCPPWMKILIRDTNDPFTILKDNKTGGINVIDLANINSCSFIATQDLGRSFSDNSFEVLGRFDNSDIRGCNLLVG
ncbi:MAG: acyl transferase [Verrucomicrobiota bacterium]